jgi:hypothetical protein
MWYEVNGSLPKGVDISSRQYNVALDIGLYPPFWNECLGHKMHPDIDLRNWKRYRKTQYKEK